MDNLNTHSISSLYEAFPPEQALFLTKRLETHVPPKHWSWLNMVKIELSSMTIQFLNRRIGSIEQLQREITAWKIDRNQARKSVEWLFTTPMAKGKLKHWYPEI